MAEPFFLNDGALTVETDTGTSTPIAGLSSVSVTPGYETNELYTADSTFRETVKQYEHSVAVEIEYMFVDVTTAQEWLGGDGTSATASTDTGDPQLFNVERVDPSADGSVERTTAVDKVVFPEFPLIDGSQDEFEAYSLSGSGRLVSQYADTSP